MRKLFLAFIALSVAVPPALVATTAPVEAKKKHYQYREWRGRDGRVYCRKPNGTTGLVIGGVTGALLGRTVDTGGDRTAGTVLGAVGGALLGREIDRSSSNNRRRCR